MRLQRLLRIGPLGTALTVGQVAWALRQHWQSSPTDRRDRLAQLLRQAKGNPSRLSASERREFRELVRELNLPRLLRRSAMDVALLRRRLRPPS
jgi:hypothetical protein